MVITRSGGGGGDCGRQGRKLKDSSTGDASRQRQSPLGSCADSDLISWLRGLALNPCNYEASKESGGRLWDQLLKLRKIMFLTHSEFPRRKRALQQFLKGEFTTTPGLVKSDQQSFKKLRRQFFHTSSISCSLNSADSIGSDNQCIAHNSRSLGSLLTFEDNFRGKHVSTNLPVLDNSTDSSSLKRDSSPLMVSDESIYGSNPVSTENLTIHDASLLDFDDSVYSSNSSNLEEPKQTDHQTPRRSIRLLKFIGDYLPRMAIPVGPFFQANVPDWTGPSDQGNLCGRDGDSESSRWLGTQIWPVRGESTETSPKTIGKGRPDSCFCASPGSADCVKLHVHEKSLLLQSDLGPAFMDWKFDEMGEAVSKSWSLKEQKTFQSLMKSNPLSNEVKFWKHAFKCFPNKCRKSIVSYYFNVFLPRHISLQTRSSLKQVDTDEDEAEDVNHTDSQEGRAKDVKARYLRRGC